MLLTHWRNRRMKIEMTIDEIIKYLPAPICDSTVIHLEKQKEYEAHDTAVIIMRKYQKMQADYENRLKADMVAMLTEIQLEIEEFMGTISPNYDEAAQDISKVIQQKINALKENEQ